MFSEFLAELKQKEIEISFTGGKIKYSGPEQYINSQLIESLKKFKGKLIRHLWPAECSNMMPINTEGSKVPFILLHGEKMNYHLSEHLGIDQPFYGFFHYGSEGEKIFHRNVESFARDYINQLQTILPNGPYYLAGFSFGGLIAFEMALQLQQQGFNVPVLILIDCKLHSLKEPLNITGFIPRTWYKTYKFSKDQYYWIYNRGRRIYYEFFLLFKIRLHHKHRNYYIMRTYMDIARRYKPKNVYKGEILLFKSQQNVSVHKYLGWDNFCDKIKMLIIKGNHNTLYESEESYNVLSKNIAQRLETANSHLNRKY
jgi:pimeloyl-ACP methyl ester carboxylesterase